MAIPSNAQAQQKLARTALRLFLNDFPELNRIIRREESDDTKLDLCITLAIADYNITPPLLGNETIVTFPSLWLLLYGAAIQVLRSAGLLHARNELVYSSAGVSVRIWDKTQLYQSWIANFVQDYEMKKANYKKTVNINATLADGVQSEYWTLMAYW